MTPFAKVYEVFLSQITDYQIKNMIENDKELELKENLQNWMFLGIGHFVACSKDLMNYDIKSEVFNVELNSLEINIIAKWMVYEYLNTKVIDDSLMKQSLNSKDYRTYSPANQINAIKTARDQISKDGNSLMSKYFYSSKNIKELFSNEKN